MKHTCKVNSIILASGLKKQKITFHAHRACLDTRYTEMMFHVVISFQCYNVQYLKCKFSVTLLNQGQGPFIVSVGYDKPEVRQEGKSRCGFQLFSSHVPLVSP